jgi:endo-1,4-beta-mannosidase
VGADDTYVHIAGNRLYYAGKPVTLKGTNYWMRTHPFIGTWTEWNGSTVRQELDKARQLGVNTVRISVPFDHSFAVRVVWGEGCGARNARCDYVNGFITNEMTQLLQIASSYGMKVLFALFDWSDDFPVPGTDGYQKNLNYLQGIVGPFAEDDRVLGWDLHNEPEFYDTWKGSNGPDKVITWAANMAAAIRGLDKRHPLTIGMGQYQNLWVQSAGKRLIDIVDFISFHCYDAGGLRPQIDAIQAHTGKPILLEEMGWPTGPAELSRPNAVYDEATQQFLYRAMLADARASSLVGVAQWTLADNPLGTPEHYIEPTIESWFGLVRRDGSFKPAAAEFRDGYPAPLLPSRTATNLPLTTSDGTPAP